VGKKDLGKKFFRLWKDPDATLLSYVDQQDEILAGRGPKRQAGTATAADRVGVADLVNHYLESVNGRLQRKEISPRHFNDCVQTSGFIVRYFGRHVQAGTLRAADFSGTRKAFRPSWGQEKTKNEIRRLDDFLERANLRAHGWRTTRKQALEFGIVLALRHGRHVLSTPAAGLSFWKNARDHRSQFGENVHGHGTCQGSRTQSIVCRVFNNDLAIRADSNRQGDTTGTTLGISGCISPEQAGDPHAPGEDVLHDAQRCRTQDARGDSLNSIQ